MARTPIFNDYNTSGFRVTVTGNRSHRTEDEAIVYNLRFKWAKELEGVSDQVLVNAYDEFAMSEDFGDNDSKFLAYLADYIAE